MVLRRIIVLGALSAFGNCVAVAQVIPGDPGNGDPDNPVPLTGLGYLLLAGGILGIRRIAQMRKKR